MIFDGNLKKLITAAFDNRKDVFLKVEIPAVKDLSFDNVRTAVFLPGSFSWGADHPFSDFRKGASFSAYMGFPDIIFCDIRFMSDSAFREYLHEKKFQRLIILFAECADSGEYGYKEAFRWIGEFRAESDKFLQVAAFFSPVETDFEYYLTAFGCKEAIFAGENTLPDIRIFETSGFGAKFYYTAAEAEKYAYKKVCVYFNSRKEASDFGSFLEKRRTPYLYFDGSLSSDEKKKVLSEYLNGRICILVATKSFIAETVFLNADRCIFCGVPFSVSHICRSCLAAKNSYLSVIYCKEDFERNKELSRKFADITGLEDVYAKRLSGLFDIKVLFEKFEKE